MRKLIAASALALAAILMGSELVVGQAQSNGPVYNLDATSMNFLWRVRLPRPGGFDYMTTNSSYERNYIVQYLGGVSEGPIYYTQSSNSAGAAPLYRLYQPNIPDHMESEIPDEGGYNLEGIQGYPWSTSNARLGLTQILRAFNPSNYDQATVQPGESLPGYSKVGGFAKWGYARYKLLDDNANLLSLTSGGVTVDSNRNAGGCVWQWTYRGVQYIENFDYGREMQSVFFFPNDRGGLNNPTECGDGFSERWDPVEDRHGSPMVVGYNSGNRQITRAAPLEWYKQNGVSYDHPMVYTNMQIGKDLEMNFANWGPVAKYSTYVKTPIDINLNQENALYIPTIYVRSNFTQYYTFDAATYQLTPRTIICGGDRLRYLPDSGFGGLIIADSAGQNAMGLFGPGANIGGDVDIFTMVNNLCLGWPNEFSILSAAYKRLLPATGRYYTTYVMSGTLAEVQNYMRKLYFLYINSSPKP